MSILNLSQTGNIIHFDQENCVAQGKRLAAQYRAAAPFPHIVIDSLIEPQILREALTDFPDIDGKEFFDRDQERFKFQFAPEEIKAGLLRNLLIEFNSKAFLSSRIHDWYRQPDRRSSFFRWRPPRDTTERAP